MVLPIVCACFDVITVDFNSCNRVHAKLKIFTSWPVTENICWPPSMPQDVWLEITLLSPSTNISQALLQWLSNSVLADQLPLNNNFMVHGGGIADKIPPSLPILLIGGYWGTTCHTEFSGLGCGWVVWKQVLGWSLGCKSVPVERKVRKWDWAEARVGP